MADSPAGDERFEYLRVPAMDMPTIPPDQFAPVKTSWDYVRHATMGLAVHRILLDGVPGDFAEAGVWRGDCAKFIHNFAPDRRLYLFDTFEGFPDLEKKTLTDDLRFRDTATEIVRSVVGDSENVIIMKGIFPDTAEPLADNRFAFVSLDLDTYEGILEGLRFFYPRLSQGGYIFIHDFNATEYNFGPYRATTEFLSTRPEKIIEIPDQWGSVLFRKTADDVSSMKVAESEHNSQQKEIEKLKWQLSHTIADLNAKRTENERLGALNTALYNSTCWRITSPLRAAVRLFRGQTVT